MRVKLKDVCEKATSNLKQSDILSIGGTYPVYGASGYLGNIDSYHQDKPYIAVVKDGAGIGRTTILPPKSSVIGTMQYLIPKENVMPEYLYYVVKHMRLQKYYTGATIPHIYFKDYQNEEFNLADSIRQREIVKVLKNVEDTIRYQEIEINKFDELIKARFVEMFCHKGYTVLEWNDVFNTRTGKLDSNAATENGKYPFFTCSKDILYIDDFGFDQEALLLAGNNAAGKYDVKYYKGKFNAYQRTYVLTLRGNWSYQLFRYQLEDKLEYLRQQSLGGLTKYLTMKILGELSFIIPPIEKQKEFESFVQQVDKSRFDIKKSIIELEREVVYD